MSVTHSTTTKPSVQSSLFILAYRGRRILIARPTTRAALEKVARKNFREIPKDYRVTFSTNEPEVCGGLWAEVTDSIWDAVVPSLSRLEIAARPDLRRDDDSEVSDCSECEGPPPKKRKTDVPLPEPSTAPIPTAPKSNPESTKPTLTPTSTSQLPASQPTPKKKRTCTIIYVSTSKEEDDRVKAVFGPSNKVEHAMRFAAARLGFDYDDVRISFNGERIGMDEKLWDLGVEDGDDIWVMPVQRGGKPVIYLQHPQGVDAKVRLTLVPEWQFSVIYPVVKPEETEEGRQMVEWDVRAERDGTMLEKNTGLEVSYLFWEAETHRVVDEPLSPRASPPPPHEGEQGSIEERFIPNRAHIVPSNSIVLRVDKVPHYLDASLKALGLNTEARTSFITYWLPAILKHPYIALRFLPQSAYAKAAPLEVTPAPDVVLRVFMLFRGLSEESVTAGEWSQGLSNRMSEEGEPEMWRNVVGVDYDRVRDEGLFRVVEWGGMEVR